MVPEGFICFWGSILLFFFELLELFLLPGVYTSAIHVAEHGDDPGKGVLHDFIVSVDFYP